MLSLVSACRHVFYLSWPLAFCISATVWIVLNTVWPPPGVGDVDSEEIDDFAPHVEGASLDEESSSKPAGKEALVLEYK